MDREPRIATRCRVLIEHQGQEISAESEDLSSRGMFIAGIVSIPLGDVVDVRISLPNRPEFTIRARVAHCLDGPAARSLGRSEGTGLEFLDPGSAGRRLLQSYFDVISVELAATAPSVAGLRRRLLVADSQTPFLVRVTNALESGNSFVVDSVANGADALVAAMEQRPDVILAAAEMPFLGGLELLRKLGNHERLSDVPVVIVFDHDSNMGRLEALRLGAADVMSKPFTDEELSIRLERVTGAKRVETTRLGSNLRGRLGDNALGTVLSVLEYDRKTGVLGQRSKAGTGRIHVRAGRVIRVEGVAEALEPRDRLMCLLDQVEGEFEFAAGPVIGRDEIDTSTQQLLLQHAKVVDEG